LGTGGREHTGVRILLISLMLSLTCPVFAESLQVVDLQWTQLAAKDGDRLQGRVVLSAPAPEGGVTVILEPTLKLKLPTTVQVDGGETFADFSVKIIDNRYVTRGPQNTTVTACLRGQEYDFPGPSVSVR
jgi:hypothetical protein